MIVRVFRAVPRPGKASAVEQEACDVSIPLVQSQDGLIAFYAGRSFDEPDEFVMITVWRDIDALCRFAGDDWQNPVIPNGAAELLSSTSVQHYELLGGVLPQLSRATPL